jgi:hypothetical protein
MTKDKSPEVKKILSKRSPRHPRVELISDDWPLAGFELQFDGAGIRALAQTITDEILAAGGRRLAVTEMDDLNSVGELCDEVNRKLA